VSREWAEGLATLSGRFRNAHNVTLANGRRALQLELDSPGFDLTVFRRSLHCIGVRAFVAKWGTRVLDDPELGPVRRYVRRPDRGEAWPFAYGYSSGGVNEFDVDLVAPTESRESLVLLRVSNCLCVAAVRPGARGELDSRRRRDRADRRRSQGPEPGFPRSDSRRSDERAHNLHHCGSGGRRLRRHARFVPRASARSRSVSTGRNLPVEREGQAGVGVAQAVLNEDRIPTLLHHLDRVGVARGVERVPRGYGAAVRGELADHGSVRTSMLSLADREGEHVRQEAPGA
jgi:hypothetical protein